MILAILSTKKQKIAINWIYKMEKQTLFLRRFMAMFIDSSLPILLIILGLYTYSYKNELLYSIGIPGDLLTVLLILLFIPLILINLLFLEGTRLRGSIGKIICRLQVLVLISEETNQTRPLLWYEALVRNFLKVFSIQLFFPIALVPFFTKRQQGLHDFVFNTIVVARERNESLNKKSNLEAI